MKKKIRYPKWQLLTNENAVIGAIVCNKDSHKETRVIYEITEIESDTRIQINIIKGGRYDTRTIYKQYCQNYYVKRYPRPAKMWLLTSSIPKERKFKCMICKQPGAKEKHGVCKECNLIPF